MQLRKWSSLLQFYMNSALSHCRLDGERLEFYHSLFDSGDHDDLANSIEFGCAMHLFCVNFYWVLLKIQTYSHHYRAVIVFTPKTLSLKFLCHLFLKTFTKLTSKIFLVNWFDCMSWVKTCGLFYWCANIADSLMMIESTADKHAYQRSINLPHN